MREVIETTLARIDAHDDRAVWIGDLDLERIRADADRVASSFSGGAPPGSLGGVLGGVPFAVKDNIDVAGIETTAGCPAFGSVPAASATAVDHLAAAGAIVTGKTNLDQFATGLVGTRSPYGTPRNPFDPAVVPGGSSSGSASRSPPASSRSPSAPTPPARVGSRPRSATSSDASPRTAS